MLVRVVFSRKGHYKSNAKKKSELKTLEICTDVCGNSHKIKWSQDSQS